MLRVSFNIASVHKTVMHDWLFTRQERVLQSDKVVDREGKTFFSLSLLPLCNYKNLKNLLSYWQRSIFE
jgi:hypothetical protein